MAKTTTFSSNGGVNPNDMTYAPQDGNVYVTSLDGKKLFRLESTGGTGAVTFVDLGAISGDPVLGLASPYPVVAGVPEPGTAISATLAIGLLVANAFRRKRC